LPFAASLSRNTLPHLVRCRHVARMERSAIRGFSHGDRAPTHRVVPSTARHALQGCSTTSAKSAKSARSKIQPTTDGHIPGEGLRASRLSRRRSSRHIARMERSAIRGTPRGTDMPSSNQPTRLRSHMTCRGVGVSRPRGDSPAVPAVTAPAIRCWRCGPSSPARSPAQLPPPPGHRWPAPPDRATAGSRWSCGGSRWSTARCH